MPSGRNSPDEDAAVRRHWAVILEDPCAVLAAMVRTRLPLWRTPNNGSFRLQALAGARPRHLVSPTVISWLLELDLIAPCDALESLYAEEIYILTAEGW